MGTGLGNSQQAKRNMVWEIGHVPDISIEVDQVTEYSGQAAICLQKCERVGRRGLEPTEQRDGERPGNRRRTRDIQKVELRALTKSGKLDEKIAIAALDVVTVDDEGSGRVPGATVPLVFVTLPVTVPVP